VHLHKNKDGQDVAKAPRLVKFIRLDEFARPAMAFSPKAMVTPVSRANE